MIEILNYKANPKPSTILGFFSCKFHFWNGLIIDGFTFCESGEKNWINVPSREYMKDGKKAYSWLVFFEDKEKNIKFKAAIYESLKKHLNGPSVHQIDETKEGVQNEPFQN